jgi:hypothetical protein
MLKMLLYGILFYLAYKVFRNLGAPSRKKEEVQGEAENKPLDLGDADIQDARFKDIDEKNDSRK